MNTIIRHLLVFILLTTASQSYASTLFENDSIIDVTLTGPLTTIVGSRKKPVELPFVLSADGVDHHVQVRLRGKSRLDVCRFPPLRINFKKSKTQDTVFSGQDKLKLVSHCSTRKTAQGDLLQEYLAYRIFNQLSDKSYRVRLARVTYVDTNAGKKNSPLVRYAFLKEASSDLIQRTNARPVEVSDVSLRSLNDEHMAKVYIFQYMIGNTDWSLVTAKEDPHCCHNGDLIDIGDSESERFYLPYDFDLSGLVNARYAYPDRSLRIKRVTQRLYRGFCTSPEVLRDALLHAKEKEADILDLVNDLKNISPKDMQISENYLNGFFHQAYDTTNLLRNFERRCL